MNIFYLDKDCVTSAQYHTDKDVVKMILEYSQLLCTAHRLLDDDVDDRLYRATHKNHPSAKYVRYTDSNYKFVYRMFTALCDEYTYRYGKVHLTDTKLRELLKTPPKNIPVGQMTRMPQAMPDEFKCCDSIIAYRNYYRIAKQHLHTWTKRAVPQFITT